MKYKALLIAVVTAATLGLAGAAQALTPAQSGSQMDTDGGHSGNMHPRHITHAPRFGHIARVFAPHHYRRHYRHY